MTNPAFDKWEPTSQDKELIGKLQVACSISTDPANKLSLVSSLITKVNAVMEYKCKFIVPPNLDQIIGELLIAMIQSEKDKIPYEVLDTTSKKLDGLFEPTNDWQQRRVLECLRDLYLVEDCSVNWKAANRVYMADKDSWGSSNAQIHDILMVLDSIIRRNDLSSIPKNAMFSTDNLNLFGKRIGAQPNPEGSN
jgi:hypothetical protein